MENLKFAEIVIQAVYDRTVQGSLQWEDTQNRVAAQATPAIRVTIAYVDDGPDLAIWEHVIIRHPVEKDITMIGNPSSPKPRLCKMTADGKMLDQLNEIFGRVLLDPRKKDFDDAMKQLYEA